MNDSIFTGCIPALMTPCKADRTPDFDALVRKGKELIEAGMSGVVYCGSMGDWPLLTDAQRMEGVARLAEAVSRGGVVIDTLVGWALADMAANALASIRHTMDQEQCRKGVEVFRRFDADREPAEDIIARDVLKKDPKVWY